MVRTSRATSEQVAKAGQLAKGGQLAKEQQRRKSSRGARAAHRKALKLGEHLDGQRKRVRRQKSKRRKSSIGATAAEAQEQHRRKKIHKKGSKLLVCVSLKPSVKVH